MTIQTLHNQEDRAAGASGNLGDARPSSGPVQQAAHDLRQPVAAILALASAAAAGTQAPEPVRLRLKRIIDEANWISKIITDMLADADVAYGAEEVDIAALARDAATSEQLTYAGRIIVKQPDGEARYVLAISTRLRRAIANILGNATRAAGQHGCVQLTERACGKTEHIEIMDDGPGFGLVAADNGIGLQITRRTVAECGGQMEIERLPSGQTLVRLLLPIMSRGRRAGAQ